MSLPVSLTEPGRFVVGCNYWASHAGTNMWADWRQDIVEKDLRQLARAGMHVLRVFLLWPDFQPIHTLYGFKGQPVETRLDEQPLGDDELGRAGLSPAAIDHFQTLADLATKYKLKLLVGLVTGWMSGRLFVPRAMEGRDVLTDPLAIQWEVRMVRAVVRRFRRHPAILAWDLGNECNCMGNATREQAWLWTNAISQAIRAEDLSRPVVSGMSGMTPSSVVGSWTIADQAELTDVLTTHPYPLFTPHCANDPVHTLGPCLHATAESCLYADVGRRPCLVEEIGTLGPMICDDLTSANYVRTALLSTWAHDCRGLLWWCAYDQMQLAHAPYDWFALERELGLFRTNRTPKPVLGELTAFGKFLRRLPIDRLPPRKTDAVCILSEGQDHWAAAFGCFILAKQAGFDIEFQHADQTLRDSRLYLLPSLGSNNIPRRLWVALLERVREGATLYVSIHDGMVVPFAEPLGLDVLSRQKRTGPASITLTFLPDQPRATIGGPLRFNLVARDAEALACEDDGNPVLTRCRLGKGQVYFLSLPMETDAAATPGAFQGPAARPCWRIYRLLGAQALAARAVRKSLPHVGLTEHPLNARRRVVVAINYSPDPTRETLDLSAPWRLQAIWRGRRPAETGRQLDIRLPANDGAVLLLSRKP